jgi:hypothetical protein
MVFKIDENGLMHKINIPSDVEDEFLELQKNGKLVYEKIDKTSLPEYTGNLNVHELYYKKDSNGNIVLDMDRILKDWKEEKIKEIESLIYSFYPQSKQNSDLVDKLYYEILLKADGVSDLETDIVNRVKDFLAGKTIDEVISDVPDAHKEAYTQLLKTVIRVEWVQNCKAELKAAISEQREPEYPKFPL